MNLETDKLIKEIDKGYDSLSMADMEAYLVKLVNKASEEYGQESLSFASILNELGGYYRSTSRYKDAEQLFQKAMGIIERIAGKNNPNYAATISNLAGLYRLTGEFSKSEQLLIDAVNIYKNNSYEESYAYSGALNNLGLLYMEMKDYSKAAELFKEASLIAGKDNKDPVVYATGLGNLAGAYVGLGQLNSAQKLLLEAVDVYKINGLESNPHFGSVVNSLGQCCFSAGDYKEAEGYFIQALELRIRDFGMNHHETAKVCDNLRVLYEKLGDYPSAEKYAAQTSDIYLKLFGNKHPLYINSADAAARLSRNKAQDKGTSGMELSLMCFAQFSVTTLCRNFPDYIDRIAAGLVGEGSECYGFDDEISRDHDFGPFFCIWLSAVDFDKIGARLQSDYHRLTNSFDTRIENTNLSERRGVFEIGSFYKRYIGLDRPPASLREWRAIPEVNLSVVTNGKVFLDTLGEFTKFRNELKSFYPEDVRLKKLAARCAIMAQAGQYNYQRSVKRSEYVAAQQALAAFTDAAVSAVFLLNKEYKPFYKWMHRALKSLPILGIELYGRLLELSRDNAVNSKVQMIEEICQLVAKETAKQGISRCSSGFLLDHANEILSCVKDPELRSMHIMAE